jgi:ABC-type transporter Mla MlaB component
MDIRELTVGQVAVLKADGVLDRLSAGRLSHGIRAAFNRGCRVAILNMSGVEQADSHGLAELMFCYAYSRNQDRQVLIAGPPNFLRELLLSSRLLPRCPESILCDSLYEALGKARTDHPL